jgi:hypothetical protein
MALRVGVWLWIDPDSNLGAMPRAVRYGHALDNTTMEFNKERPWLIKANEDVDSR